MKNRSSKDIVERNNGNEYDNLNWTTKNELLKAIQFSSRFETTFLRMPPCSTLVEISSFILLMVDSINVTRFVGIQWN